jgi:homoserine kinase
MRLDQANAMLGRKVVVKVPATTANLGPGFDTLGMALSFYDELAIGQCTDSLPTLENNPVRSYDC